MSIQYTVSLGKLIKILNMRTIYIPPGENEVLVSSADINRPGLQLAGFFDYFNSERIQLFGRSEAAYLTQLAPERQKESMERLFAAQPVAVIFARNIEPDPTTVELAEKYKVPLLGTTEVTSDFSSALNALLNTELAPRVTRHGVLVEVYGEGVLLLGDSGVGKSETAVELVNRGHRLIADDAVEIRRVSNKTLVGSSPENIRHFLELRGIGIINVRRIFGVGAVKVTEKIDVIINLEQWNQSKTYDRMGIDNEYTEILGISISSLTIPVKPGRNLAIIIEVAAMNNRQKKLGHNAAHELLERLGMTDDIPKEELSEEERPYDYYQ